MRHATFKAGGALAGDHQDVYVERQADREVLSHILAMDYLLVIEPRQQGKTSLINNMMRHPGLANYAFVYVDVTSPDRSSQSSWYQTLCTRILKQLATFMPSGQPPAIPTTSVGWRDFLTQITISVARSGRRLIIQLDEIGALSFPGNTEFFGVLRDIYNSRQVEPEFMQLTFLLAGAFHPRNLINDDKISPFNIAQRVRLHDFTQEQVTALVQHGLWSNERAESLSERIYSWTAGQPYLTQLLCIYLNENSQATDVDVAVERLRRDDENHIPPMLAKISDDVNLQKYLELIQSGKQIKFYPQENPRQSQLELLGVLGAGHNGYCVIRNRIYEQALEGSASSVSVRIGSVPPDVSENNVRGESFALVMKGGGVKGLAYVGALKELQKYYDFNWFVGTSAGAIAAVLLAAGYTTDELEMILKEKDFSDFLDTSKLGALMNLALGKGGMFEARTLRTWLDRLFHDKGLRGFEPVALKRIPRRVTMYASRRYRPTLIFDSEDPEQRSKSASFAVRCSMSIPLIFTPLKEEDIKVLDGGMRNNYPINELLSRSPGTKFIGLYLGNYYQGVVKTSSLLSDILHIWTEAVDVEALTKYEKDTVIIDPRPIGTVDFHLSTVEKDFLLKIGRASALRFLHERQLEGGPTENEVKEAEAQAQQTKIQVEAFRRRKRWRRWVKLV